VVGWKLALVTASAIPVLLGCGYLRFAVLAALSSRKKKASAASASYACEAVSAIKTVASLTREQSILSQYRASLEMQLRESMRSVVGSAGLYAASQSITYLCMALGFWYGGTLISRGEYSLLQFYICYAAIIFGAQSAGTIFAFARKFTSTFAVVVSRDNY
jgi:ATP-binding cassette subfamily B (MDR/TAP) protein 1